MPKWLLKLPPIVAQNRLAAAGVAAALLGLALFALWITLRTPDGTLVVTQLDPQAYIEVLDDRGELIVEQKAGAETVEIRVAPGRGMLRVVKRTAVLFVRQFSVVSGGKEEINARLALPPRTTPIAKIESPLPPRAAPRAEPRVNPAAEKVPQTIVRPAAETSKPTEPAGGKSPAPAQSTTSQREIDLLKLVDPARDSIRGKWRLLGDGLLASDPAQAACIEIPYEPPEEYDFRIVFVSTFAREAVQQICRGGGSQFAFTVGGWNNAVSGFQMIKGQMADRNPTTTNASRWLVSGRRHVSVVKLRKDGVEGWFDDKRVAGYKTDWTDMSLPSEARLRRPNSIGIMAWLGVRVESATIIEITGEGKQLPPWQTARRRRSREQRRTRRRRGRFARAVQPVSTD